MKERDLVVEGGGENGIDDYLAVPDGWRVRTLLLELDDPFPNMAGRGDLDPRLPHGHGRANLTTFRRDIAVDGLPEGGFDVVHGLLSADPPWSPRGPGAAPALTAETYPAGTGRRHLGSALLLIDLRKFSIHASYLLKPCSIHPRSSK